MRNQWVQVPVTNHHYPQDAHRALNGVLNLCRQRRVVVSKSLHDGRDPAISNPNDAGEAFSIGAIGSRVFKEREVAIQGIRRCALIQRSSLDVAGRAVHHSNGKIIIRPKAGVRQSVDLRIDIAHHEPEGDGRRNCFNSCHRLLNLSLNGCCIYAISLSTRITDRLPGEPGRTPTTRPVWLK